MDWKIHVEYRPGDMRTYVYVTRRQFDGPRQFLTKGGELVVTKESAKDAVDDAELHFLAVEEDYILSLLIEALDKRGVKAPAQSYIEGKFEATQAHLEDLRKLIPKLTPTNSLNT